ncbi:OTU domain-containing protein 4, partial [Kryptolebias marmoratus]|uniref:OTU domain-containing protein 4 n=1 Tax=Kryptolebias marmoratus TaxID=37003 RepID=UPI000D5304EE
MDSGGNMQSSEERSAEKAMDTYLKSIGLHRKKIAKDGSCLFRAVAEQVLHCQSLHTEVRSKCVDFLRRNRDTYEAFIEGDFEEYLFKLQDPQWVGEVEINALAAMYRRDFEIFQEPGKPAVNITVNNFKDKVQLCFLNGNHYDSVYPIHHIRNAGLCQSILYELLYDGVFKVDRSFLAPCQRAGRPNDFLSDDAMNVCGSSDESDDGVERGRVENGTSAAAASRSGSGFRGRGRGRQLPERVRRSLNPTLLRNVEYDIWHKTKRAQQKMDYSIAAGMQFTVGDRCQVRLEGGGRSYNATIQDVPPANGPVTVYIEELGTKQVPLWNIRPPSTENSWSTVVHRDKRLSNGHGGWEDRGKGRGRGKSTPAAAASSSPSSVTPATAAGSGGRVQKQHSWPPQATVEEQGGGKPGRKSAGSVEQPYFGLTKEQRVAKEEEERNMALMEIQLRDEHSFPALGTQAAMAAEGGRRKSGERRRSQRTKTMSPVEDVVSSPPAGERPKSSTPPPPAAIATSSVDSAPPAAASGSSPSLPPAKTSLQSYASAAAAPASPPASIKPPAPSSAGIFSFIPPVFPPASSSPPPPQPTFIAPIAPCPAAAQGFLRPFSPSPPPSSSSSSSVVPPQVREAPPPPNVLPKTEGSLPESPVLPKVAPNLDQVSGSHEENRTQDSSQNQTHTKVQSPEPPPDASRVSASPPVQSEALPPPQPESPPAPPPSSLPQPLPGAVPLQLTQVFQDPLYPGFPQGEKGEVQQIPPFSSSRTGDDLPKDVNILRFFFNLGVKAYSMPIVSPYLYLLPLQQIYTMQAKPPSHSPSVLYPSSSPPARPPEAQYPPPSASPLYEHQTPPAEPPQPAYQGLTQPPPQRISWQPLPPPRNPSYPVGYASPPP